MSTGRLQDREELILPTSQSFAQEPCSRVFSGEVDVEGGATRTTAGAPAEGKEDLALVCPGTLFTIFPGEVDVEGGATGTTAGAPAEGNEDGDTAFA